MTALLLDVGNSRLKWGVLENDTVGDTGHVPLQDFAHDNALAASGLPNQVQSAIACNVAGTEVAAALAEFIDSNFGVSTRFVQPSAAACGVQNGYREPASLGIDRWVALVAARARTSSACLVVDAGTAITIDAMDPNGVHLGGQILPGLKLMAHALNRNTGDLPAISTSSWRDSCLDEPFAAATPAAISNGILAAVLGAIERGLQSMQAGNADVNLILTGGDADLVQRNLPVSAELCPHLVLEGLACLAADEPGYSSGYW